eukprot:GEMP01064198.1.p1 GENE.GEMP01064198.1~~GEMP01064198.1.p1  ORF type:complete len:177 (+),score=41.22 GEMP01064198.1:152-682(+)
MITFDALMERLDLYASSSASSAWTPELLNQTLGKWDTLKTQTRRKILTSFFFMKNPVHLKHCRIEMNAIILEATKDRSDEWVRSLSRLLEGFPESGRIDYWKVDGELLYKTNEDVQDALERYDGLDTKPFHLKKTDWDDEFSCSDSETSSEEVEGLWKSSRDDSPNTKSGSFPNGG